MTEFTPITSLAGGVLIGLAALWMMAALGRIAGVSGLLGRLIPPGAATGESRRVSLGFVLGMLAAPLLLVLLNQPVEQNVSGTWPVLAFAGLLVGVGTSIGSGCTSGHGVCGLSRLSVRSAVATAAFMVCAGLTVYVVRHVLGFAV